MRFIDTNVLVYALLAPKKRALSAQEQIMLKCAKAIMARVEAGEPVATSIVHISEFVNIVQDRVGISAACDVVSALLSLPALRIATVKLPHYDIAVEIARHEKVSINDCIAFALMSQHRISEVYSFDSDFDRLGVTRVTT